MNCGRKMIYFSLYQDGRKTESAGYAGVFFREDACDVQIYYRGLVNEETKVGQTLRPVYVFRDGTMVEGRPLPFSEGMAVDSFSTRCQNFLESDRNLEELEAVYIAGVTRGTCGGRVDGRELLEETAYTLADWMDTVTELIPKTGQKQEILLELQEKMKQTESETKESEEREKPGENQPVAAEKEEQPKELERWSLEKCMEELPEQKLPFDGIRRKCCRMNLEELGHLPKEWEVLKKNNFLLHGYYEYHHLLLIQLCGRCGIRYALGVPGEFCCRTQYMAENFGFTDFSPLEQGKRCKGSFGYWYCYLGKEQKRM